MKTRISLSSAARAWWRGSWRHLRLVSLPLRRAIRRAVFHGQAFALGFELRHGLPIVF